MTDIAIQLILTAEIKYRENVVHGYQWRIKRKAELEEEQRKRKVEAERAEKERQKRLEQARVNRLLRDAAAFQQAGEIRKYVDTIRRTLAREGSSSSEEVENGANQRCLRPIGSILLSVEGSPRQCRMMRQASPLTSNLDDWGSSCLGIHGYTKILDPGLCAH
ncbi:MAG: hypothetical protein WA485_17940 [Candidatus Sulfotelmatobacter sp.]